MLRNVIKSSIIIIVVVIYKISPKIIDFLIEINPPWEVTLKGTQ